MCLHTNQSKPFIAKEDITCYKIVNKISDTKVESDVMEFFYTLNKLYTIPELKLVKSKIIGSYFKKYIIAEGFHSYIQLSDAVIDCKCELSLLSSTRIIVECIIPKGSKYFLGYNDYRFECYCSDKIIITNIMNSKINENILIAES